MHTHVNFRRGWALAALLLLLSTAVASGPNGKIPQTDPRCPEDFDLDGTVGGGDLNILLSCFGSTASVCSKVDLDGDGDVDAADLANLLNAFGPCCLCDFNGDGSVAQSDIDFVSACFGGTARGLCTGADIDMDGDVDGSDLAALLGKFGPCP